MRVDNPLTREYLLNYPMDAARNLEQVSVEHVAAFFSELPVKTAATVMAAMLPNQATDCLQTMAAVSAAKVLAELPVTFAVRVYRLMSTEKRIEIFTLLSDRSRKHIQRYLKFPSVSVGAMLDPVVDMLPADVTVSGAIRYIERLKHAVNCEIYVIDETQRLVGMIEIGKLLKSGHHLKLKNIMNRKTQRVSAFARAETVVTHPGWVTRRSLPVVDRDNTLVGILEFNRLRDSLGEIQQPGSPDNVEGLLSFAGFYWLTVAQLLDSLFGIARSKGGRS